MKNLIQFITLSCLIFTSVFAFSQSQTQTFTTGQISLGGNTSADECTGDLAFSIPAGSVVDSIRTWYNVEATGGGYGSDARSKVECLEGAAEATYTSGTLGSGGTESYNRSISTLYTGVTATGILNFRIYAWDSYNSAMACGAATDVFIQDGTWIVTVYYTAPPTVFVYNSSATTQTNTTNIPHCSSDQQIIGLEVDVTGNIGTFDLTEIQFNMTGTTSIADATSIKIYYTGTTASFSTGSLYGTVAPATGTITMNGVQGLVDGINYFWIAYDMAGAIYSGGNTMDAECTQITIEGNNYNPSPSNPGTGRTTEGCQTYPGNVSTGVKLWFKANEAGFADNSPATSWTDESNNGNDAEQTDANKQPYYRDNTAYNLNFNPVIDFIRDDITPANSDRLDFTTPTNLTQNIFIAFATTHSNNQSSWHYDYSMIYGGDINPFVVAGQSDFVIGMGDWYGPGTNLSLGGGSNADWKYPSSTTVSTGLPKLLTFDKVNTNASQLDLQWRMNGALEGAYSVDSIDCGTSMPSNSALGASPTTATSGFDGSISEVIVFDHILTSAEQNKVESYLAIKYGVTLDQSTPQNYVLGDGTISWNSAIVPVLYNNDIAGISRDDLAEQYQKQSRSVNPGSLVTIGLGPIATTNLANGSTFLTNKHTLTWSNNRDANAWVLAEVPPLVDFKLEREWFTEENFGDVGTVTIEVADADFPPTGGSIVHLLIDADGDFSTGATIIPMTLVAGIWTLDVNFTDEYYFSFGINTTPLPIKLLDFNATPIKDKVKLDWSTASELNNDYFTIEKSVDGLSWKEVTKVNGTGTSQHTNFYSTIDPSPYLNTSYYRLKQTDYDGMYTYSEIRTVHFGQMSDVSVYPNPAKDFIVIEGSSIELNNLKIFNTSGQSITGQVAIERYAENRHRVDLSRLSAGIYYVQAGTEFIKFVIN